MTNGRRKSDHWTVRDVVTALMGGLFLVAGGALFINELRDTERHTAHLAMAFGAAVFGAAMMNPDVIFDRVGRLAKAGAAFLPWAKPDVPQPPDAGPG